MSIDRDRLVEYLKHKSKLWGKWQGGHKHRSIESYCREIINAINSGDFDEEAPIITHSEIKNTMRMIANEEAIKSELDFTDAEIADACMSRRHDFGLISDIRKRALKMEAKEWLTAFKKVVKK
jgi:hypothetical protein